MQIILALREIFQGRSWLIILIFIGLTFCVGCVGYLFAGRAEQRKVKLEKAMTPNHFTLRFPKGELWGLLLEVLMWGIALPALLLVVDGMDEMIIFTMIGFLIAPLRILFSVYRTVWRLTVEGNTIHYTSLLGRKTISFYEIQRADVHLKHDWDTETRTDVRIRLYTGTGRRFSVPAKAIGFPFFLERLKQRNVAGIEVLFSENPETEDASEALL